VPLFALIVASAGKVPFDELEGTPWPVDSPNGGCVVLTVRSWYAEALLLLLLLLLLRDRNIAKVVRRGSKPLGPVG
jgi:hypothetical protein